jgi:hypothetical protein
MGYNNMAPTDNNVMNSNNRFFNQCIPNGQILNGHMMHSQMFNNGINEKIDNNLSINRNPQFQPNLNQFQQDTHSAHQYNSFMANNQFQNQRPQSNE